MAIEYVTKLDFDVVPRTANIEEETALRKQMGASIPSYLRRPGIFARATNEELLPKPAIPNPIETFTREVYRGLAPLIMRGNIPGMTPEEEIRQEYARQSHPVASTAGQMTAGIAPYLALNPLFRSGLAGQALLFGTVGGMQAASRPGSLMDTPMGRAADIGREAATNAAYAIPYSMGGMFSMAGHPYASAIGRAAIRGAGVGATDIAFGGDLTEAVKQGGIVGALSLIMEAPALAKTALGRGIIKRANAIAAEAGLPEGQITIDPDRLDAFSMKQKLSTLVNTFNELGNSRFQGTMRAPISPAPNIVPQMLSSPLDRFVKAQTIIPGGEPTEGGKVQPATGIPKLSDSIEAINYGKSISGDPAKISMLAKAWETNSKLVSDIVASGDKTKINAAYLDMHQTQMMREALETATGKGDYLTKGMTEAEKSKSLEGLLPAPTEGGKVARPAQELSPDQALIEEARKGSEQKYRVAFDIDGKIYQGKEGEIHSQLLNRLPKNIQERYYELEQGEESGFVSGFVDKNNEFQTRGDIEMRTGKVPNVEIINNNFSKNQPDQALIEEARKYKSAKEFANAFFQHATDVPSKIRESGKITQGQLATDVIREGKLNPQYFLGDKIGVRREPVNTIFLVKKENIPDKFKFKSKIDGTEHVKIGYGEIGKSGYSIPESEALGPVKPDFEIPVGKSLTDIWNKAHQDIQKPPEGIKGGGRTHYKLEF